MGVRPKPLRGLVACGLVAIFGVTAGLTRAGTDDPDPNSKAILASLEEPVELRFTEAPLEDVLKFIKAATAGPNDSGIPIFVDPGGLEKAGKTMQSPVTIATKAGEPLKTSLKRLLKPIGMAYRVQDGLLRVTSAGPADE